MPGASVRAGVIRLYPEDDFVRRSDHDTPEIMRRELSHVLLDIQAMEIPELEWFERPPEAALDAARELLARLGAVDAAGLTRTGREMARLPLHPRLARLVVEAQRRGAGDAGCAIAALLSAGERIDARPEHPAPSDLFPMMEREWQATTRRVYEQVRRSVPGALTRRRDEEAILISVLCAFPDRVARRRQANEYLLAGGGSAALAETSAASGQEFIVAVDIEARREHGLPLIRIASAIRPDWLLDLFPERVQDRSGVEWNRRALRVERVSALMFDGLTIDETRTGDPDAEAAAGLLAAKALEAGIHRFVDRAELDAFLARGRFCGRAVAGHSGDRRGRPAGGGSGCVRGPAQLRRSGGTGSDRRPSREDPGAPDWHDCTLLLRSPGDGRSGIRYGSGKRSSIASRLEDFFARDDDRTVIVGFRVVDRIVGPEPAAGANHNRSGRVLERLIAGKARISEEISQAPVAGEAALSRD